MPTTTTPATTPATPMPHRETVHYSDGRAVLSVIAIWDDLHAEQAGYYRAFWVSHDDVLGNGSPVVGYCSPGGSFKTIRACVADTRRRHPGIAIFRHGREVR